MADAVTPEDTQRALQSEQRLAVIDIREPLDYSHGHIGESTLVPRRLLEFRLPAVVPNETATVILCDRHGERAHIDADWLGVLGYEDVSYIEGGMDAWENAGLRTIEAQDGVYSTAFNYPSKDFGEKVQVEEDVEQIQPEELNDLLDDEDEDVLVTDVRTPDEYRSMTIPGALNVEGVDLGLYIGRLRDEKQTVVVNCAGRTRSIIGTASLKKLGFENVYELENGTMGWDLAGYELEHGADRHVRKMDLDEEYRGEIRSAATSLLEANDIPLISVDEFRSFRDDENEVVYPVDVRTLDEYEAGHVPGTVAVPGGQAIQTADEHFAVRNGTIVFLSDEHIRSAITAYWFDEMGFPDVTVLEDGLTGWQDAGLSLATGREQTPPLRQTDIADMVTYVSASELATSRDSGDSEVIDIRTSERFERGHIPGAKWVPRYELEGWLDQTDDGTSLPPVLTCQRGHFSTYAAAAVQHELGHGNVRVLEGGTAAWEDSERPLEEGTGGMDFEPRDDVPKPYQQGDWAKQAYLDWEEALGEKYA